MYIIPISGVSIYYIAHGGNYSINREHLFNLPCLPLPPNHRPTSSLPRPQCRRPQQTTSPSTSRPTKSKTTQTPTWTTQVCAPSKSDSHSLIEMYFPQQVPSLRLPSSAAVAVQRVRKTRRTPTLSPPPFPQAPRRRPGRRGSGVDLPRYVVRHHQFEHQPGSIWLPPGPIVLRILPLSRALYLPLLYCSLPLASPLARLPHPFWLGSRMLRPLTEPPRLSAETGGRGADQAQAAARKASEESQTDVGSCSGTATPSCEGGRHRRGRAAKEEERQAAQVICFRRRMNPMDRIFEHFCRRMYKYTSRIPLAALAKRIPTLLVGLLDASYRPLKSTFTVWALFYLHDLCDDILLCSVVIESIQPFTPTPRAHQIDSRLPHSTRCACRFLFLSLKRISSVFCPVSCYDYTCGSYYMLWSPLAFPTCLSVSLCLSVFAKRRVFIG